MDYRYWIKQVNKQIKEKAHRGFTILELLVVFVVIAILVAIILAGAEKYFEERNNALIKSGLQDIMVYSAHYLDFNENYAGFCNDQLIEVVNASFQNLDSSVYCANTEDDRGFCVCAPLSGWEDDNSSVFCADSSGRKGIIKGAITPINCISSCVLGRCIFNNF